MTYLIDSDYVADYLKGKPPAVTLLDHLAAAGIAISAVTLAEVYEGIYYGKHPSQYKHGLRQFLRPIRVLAVNRLVAYRYAIISGDVRARGILIPPPDMFIAATAIQYHLVLVTRNLRHYQRIPTLQ